MDGRRALTRAFRAAEKVANGWKARFDQRLLHKTRKRDATRASFTIRRRGPTCVFCLYYFDKIISNYIFQTINYLIYII